MSTLSSAELDALIEELTINCYNEEEHLTGLLTGAEEALVVGEIATIAETEIRIVAVDCPSDARRGLIAVCERDGQRIELSLADLRFADASELGRAGPTLIAIGSAANRIMLPAEPTERSICVVDQAMTHRRRRGVEMRDVCVRVCVHVRLGRTSFSAACCSIAPPDLQVFSSSFSSL